MMLDYNLLLLYGVFRNERPNKMSNKQILVNLSSAFFFSVVICQQIVNLCNQLNKSNFLTQ